jgi:hypothetical protein
MLRRVIPIAMLFALGAPGTAAATPGPRYASPTGTAAQDCTTVATACDIGTAIDGSGANNPVAGQEVIVEPGTYTLSAPLAPTVNTVIHGANGQPRPVIKAAGFSALYPVSAFNLHVSDLEIDVTVNGNDGINTSGAIFDRVVIKGSSNGGNVCQCYDGTMRNSVIVNTGPTGGAWGINSNGGTGTETLRNDTFIASQAGAYAMFVQQDQVVPSGPYNIDAKNVIALNTAPGSHDVYAYGTQVTITMAYSDYSHPLQANTGVVANGGHNVASAPVFVDQAGGDFQQRLSSPTVDAGIDDTVNDGSLDVAGGPRLKGAHTDIGAFEYQPPAAIAPAGATPQSAVVGSAFAQPLLAKVTDAQGNPVFGITVTFTAPGAPSATFPAGVATQATTGASGVATAPALTAGHHAGAYSVTASAAGVATGTSLPLTNLPGPATAMSLTPTANKIAAGVAQGYGAETFDAYGNDAGPAGAGVRLVIAPDGSCAGLRCTGLVPRDHTVTATLGALTATAHLSVTAVAPRLAFNSKSAVIGHRSRRGSFTVSCGAPSGEICSISGKVTVRRHRRTLTIGAVSGRIRSGAHGRLSVVIGKRNARDLHGRTVRATAGITVVDLSGRATVRARFSLRIR